MCEQYNVVPSFVIHCCHNLDTIQLFPEKGIEGSFGRGLERKPVFLWLLVTVPGGGRVIYQYVDLPLNTTLLAGNLHWNTPLP